MYFDGHKAGCSNVLRQARLISGDSGLMVCVVGSRWILGYHGVLLQEVTQKSLRNLRYCNHNFYFVGSTSECNLGVIRVYYVSNSILFVLKQSDLLLYGSDISSCVYNIQCHYRNVDMQCTSDKLSTSL